MKRTLIVRPGFPFRELSCYIQGEHIVKMCTSQTVWLLRTRLFFLVAFGMLALSVRPADSQSASPGGTSTPVPMPIAPAAGSMEVNYEAGKLSVKADKADLGSLLKTISGSAGIGIEIGEGVTGSVSLVFTDLSLEDGINRILEAAGARSFAATFTRADDGKQSSYRLDKVVVAKQGASSLNESQLPPVLDTAHPPGMFIDEKKLRYRGKGKVRGPLVRLGEGEVLAQVLHQKNDYDSVLIERNKKWYFRILDKQGKVIFEKEVPFGVNPSLVGNTAMFVEPRKIGSRREGEPILAGLTFFDFNGWKVADVPPGVTGEITIRATTPEGLVVVNASGGLDVYDSSGKKLSHLAGLAYRSELSPDNNFIYTWEANQSELTNGAFLYDLKGNRLSELWGKREEGVVILAVSRDSRFFAYQKTDLKTRLRSTNLVDIRSQKVVRTLPILERDVAIGDNADYIAVVGTGFPREKGTYVYPRYFRLYDGQGTVLCEFSLGEDKGGATRASVNFVTATRVRMTFGNDLYYFETTGRGE